MQFRTIGREARPLAELRGVIKTAGLNHAATQRPSFLHIYFAFIANVEQELCCKRNWLSFASFFIQYQKLMKFID